MVARTWRQPTFTGLEDPVATRPATKEEFGPSDGGLSGQKMAMAIGAARRRAMESFELAEEEPL